MQSKHPGQLYFPPPTVCIWRRTTTKSPLFFTANRLGKFTVSFLMPRSVFTKLCFCTLQIFNKVLNTEGSFLPFLQILPHDHLFNRIFPSKFSTFCSNRMLLELEASFSLFLKKFHWNWTLSKSGSTSWSKNKLFLLRSQPIYENTLRHRLKEWAKKVPTNYIELTKAFTLRDLFLDNFRGDCLHYFGGNMFVKGLFKELDFEIFTEILDELKME